MNEQVYNDYLRQLVLRDERIEVLKKRVQDLEDLLDSIRSYYKNFDKEIANEKYTCHQKHQEVVSVDTVKESLFPFEALVLEGESNE